ncbi:MAG: nucleotidyltransferase family protein [Pseudodesulfovibrio sp.]|uniref:Nucleotidyl transferase n=1 Tax=Pseudodesulfovibrio aespoeensis (strain ATCC 700646 / DSM 10631 / Aspo-2) TaxID=643562 RepID=E6VR16_PSEA9|nr:MULTISPECIES: nucleotidyltransferase family protein [Pseudodesulfovibrio]MBU4244470.1 nucleotidyltransferase family protein [Pseudomonadota bacterium]ADU62996.1 Nucleotidyl transferase [Pseudodesulfovibrio aespoeensis Aspo-2]MBU4378110.1 nucleotidyltransferase family protein [Pseudomonadota bacterium]MBU4475900.1 nucleotidyltransferase family protein [Pseudomonadota bacterium]MBU4516738.1 nucleotidyltransferase family protein [Pseudomonadota bacterium]
MKDWRKAVIPLTATVRDAVEALTLSSVQIALVARENGHLDGVITDGDIRRGLLAGKTLKSPAREVMETNFFTARESDDPAVLLATMRERDFRQVPLLDADGCLVGLRTLMDMITPPKRDNWVVLMAGGLGQRLRPLTEDCPKPLLSVGGKPLLETILGQFVEHGFEKFYISVNYRAEMVEAHFGDGSRHNVEIRYLRENEQLGTAGALGLMEEKPEAPIFVMNGDLLTRVDFPGMLDFHLAQKARATMAVRSFDIQVPFGVVQVDNHRITSIEEKPVHQFFVNAGIYVLAPDVAAAIPKGNYLDMPTLFSQLMDAGETTAAFPIHEYWMDIGRKQDFDQANCDYDMHFKGMPQGR